MIQYFNADYEIYSNIQKNDLFQKIKCYVLL